MNVNAMLSNRRAFMKWAAGIPPIENLSMPWKMGADLYTFSGGKGLWTAVLGSSAGPQGPD